MGKRGRDRVEIVHDLFFCAFRWYKPICTLECEEQTGLAKRRLEVESGARGGNGGTASCKRSLTDGQKEVEMSGNYQSVVCFSSPSHESVYRKDLRRQDKLNL